MSHTYASLPELVGRPHKKNREDIVGALKTGFQASDAFVDRAEHPHVVAFRTEKKVGPIVETMVKRSVDSKSPFEAGLVFNGKLSLPNTIGLVVVNRNVKLVERSTRNPSNVGFGPQIDTCSVVLFENDPAAIEEVNRFVLAHLGLRRPVAIEPESSDPEIHKALLEVYGSGMVGNFISGINGRPISSTAYGVNL